MHTNAAFNQKYCNNSKMWDVIAIKNSLLFELNVIYSCDAQLYFQHHYSSLQHHMILQKSLKYADLLLKKHFLLFQCWKQLCCSENHNFSGFFKELNVQKYSIYLKYCIKLL